MRKLIRLEVDGLLGQFDHRVPFPASWEFVIVHGPNGVGKTKLLELIRAALTPDPRRLSQIPFETARFWFDDKTTLEVRRTGQMSLEVGGDAANLPGVAMSLYEGEVPVVEGVPLVGAHSRVSQNAIRQIERQFPVERTGADVWFDHDADEYLSLAGLLDRYGDYIPDRAVVEVEPTPALNDFLSDFNVHLIETQRLLRLTPRDPRRARHIGPEAQQVTVAEFAEDLTVKIREALAQNSRRSQELDRTFPPRVLRDEGVPPPEATEERIRQRYAQQNELRTRLEEIAVLDTSGEVPLALPTKTLQPWQRSFLWTYLDDNDEKLATFQRIHDRVRLLRDIVNSRFLFKELVIDRDRGFRFITTKGREIDATRLSSGEQHELVLAYDLLFNVEKSSLVLIDEPEISLHVAWQQAFLNDIVQIADVADLRFIVATHSPQVIHKWWERAVAIPYNLDTGDESTEDLFG